MPFIKQEHRQKPDTRIAGERCYIEYKKMMEQWTTNPRWATIDKMIEDLVPDELDRAKFLAFLVFFNIHGMKYEESKRRINGDIE